MRDLTRYHGIIPAFYACYDDNGNISPERVRALTRYHIEAGVKGVYVCGSSGECIYQSKEERKLVLENVVSEANGRLTIIAHVACNNTADSMELAAHAESLGVNAIASIPPIYFHLPEYGIEKYWNDISSAAPNTDFIIYNIPQLAGTALTVPLLKQMLKNPRVIGVKNSSMPVQDIQMFKDECGEDGIVFNGPDEQFIGGLIMGAQGAIGGTFGAMPRLYLKAYELLFAGEHQKALELQYEIDRIIYALCSCKCNMYAAIKELLKRKGLQIGSVRAPLAPLFESDLPILDRCEKMIAEAHKKYDCE